jgi:hypothetical protein
VKSQDPPKVRSGAALAWTTTCRAQADGDHAYACIAISKGLITQGHTWWPEIRQRFSPISAKNGHPARGCTNKQTERRGEDGASAQDQLAHMPATGLPHSTCVQEAIPPRMNDGGLFANFL